MTPSPSLYALVMGRERCTASDRVTTRRRDHHTRDRGSNDFARLDATPTLGPLTCTGSTLAAREVIERYFLLSTSNSVEAVIDCFAKPWRDGNAGLTATAALWSHSGPATNVVATPLDVANGCERFDVKAQMPPDSSWMRGQSGGRAFFSVGTEAGRMRIYEIATGLANAANTTLRCG